MASLPNPVHDYVSLDSSARPAYGLSPATWGLSVSSRFWQARRRLALPILNASGFSVGTFRAVMSGGLLLLE